MFHLPTSRFAPIVLAATGLVLVGLARGDAQDAPSSPRKVAEILLELTDVVVDHRPLVQVVVDLERRHNLPILFDADIVPGSAAYGDPHVTCELRQTPLGSALREMLAGVNLEYVVRANDLLIVTEEKARLLNRWPTGSIKAANDARISETLEQSTEFEFNEQPLTDVVQYLKQKHGLDIQLDESGLKEAGVGVETPISRTVAGITLESALDLVFTGLDLAWLIRDEVLLVTSTARAKGLIETRVYPVLDLVLTPPGMLPPVDGPDYDALVEILSESAASDQGPAYPRPIRIYRPSGALIITWPVASHRRVEKLLAGLRRAKAAQMGTPSF
ncbi:MAG TPA: hypothetical protein VG125_31525 [Pirellulales bacterium]|jgi:hypothetical protein|nr:hypothetical protein [Pirellulales bacterium]